MTPLDFKPDTLAVTADPVTGKIGLSRRQFVKYSVGVVAGLSVTSISAGCSSGSALQSYRIDSSRARMHPRGSSAGSTTASPPSIPMPRRTSMALPCQPMESGRIATGTTCQ